MSFPIGARGSGWWLAILTLLVARISFAADLKTRVSAQRVGVGQTFIVQVTAPSGDGPEPTNPTLPVQGAATVQGPSIQSQRSIVMHNFNVQSETNVIATWRVTPTATGTLVVGPARFTVGNGTKSGEKVEVVVVDNPQPQGRSRGPFGNDPFGNDPFGFFGKNSPFGQDPFGDDDDPFGRFTRLRDAPPEWQLSHAADPVAFLDARLDKQRVVLGEPVKLTILAYGSRGDFSEIAERSPSLADFVSFPVVQNSMEEPLYQTTIDGQRFFVRKLREFILVPLSTGKLTIGPMWTVLQNQRRAYPRTDSYEGMKVTSLPLDLQVVDAPEKGRPVGYFPGDVGRYELEADVQPRKLKQGEYAQVLINVKGQGYVPSKVLLPESKQVVWNTPLVRGEPEVKNDRLGGTRTLDFSVKVNQAGTIDLGKVRLPHYDARSKRYRVAEAELGQVQVEPASQPAPLNASQPTTAESSVDSLLSLSPRSQLGEATQRPSPFPAWAWWSVFGVPASVLLGRGSGRLAASLVSRARKPKARASGAHLSEARNDFKQGKPLEALGQLERALFTAIESSTGLKARGVLKAELPHELQARGVNDTLSRDITRLLEQLETARYAREEQAGEDLLLATERALKQLSGITNRAKGKGS